MLLMIYQIALLKLSLPAKLQRTTYTIQLDTCTPYGGPPMVKHLHNTCCI